METSYRHDTLQVSWEHNEDSFLVRFACFGHLVPCRARSILSPYRYMECFSGITKFPSSQKREERTLQF